MDQIYLPNKVFTDELAHQTTYSMIELKSDLDTKVSFDYRRIPCIPVGSGIDCPRLQEFVYA
jgi:hypothetical protein